MRAVRSSGLTPDALAHAVACLVLILVILKSDSASAEPWQARFLDECLTPGATRFTPEFNAYHLDSYVVNKADLAESLPLAARRKGLQLRALLVVGPQSPLWSYVVFTFLQEGGWIRVNALVMPHARITGKSTGFLTPRQFALLSEHLRSLSFARAARDTSALRAELSTKQTSQQAELDAEWEYGFLFARFEPEPSPLLFGPVTGQFGASSQRELSAVLEPLTDVLAPTYQPALRDPAAVRKMPWTLAVWPLISFQHDPLPELNRELAELGYAGLDASEHWLGAGFEASWRRLRLGTDLALALPRLARHAAGADARASFGRRRVALRVGYDVLAEPGFRVFPMLALGVGAASLSGGTEAAPLIRAAPSERAGSIELEQQFESLEVALGFDGHIPLSHWLHEPWLIVGARVGGVLASSHDSWKAGRRGGFSEIPGAPESSFFGMFVFGLGYEPR